MARRVSPQATKQNALAAIRLEIESWRQTPSGFGTFSMRPCGVDVKECAAFRPAMKLDTHDAITYITYMRTVIATRTARRHLKEIPAHDQGPIRAAIRDLANWPDCRNVKALKGSAGYRLRVGRYRVLFTVEEKDIVVTEVTKRDERTYH